MIKYYLLLLHGQLKRKKKYFRGQNGTDYNFYVSKELKAEGK